jgi:hypothetical protein
MVVFKALNVVNIILALPTPSSLPKVICNKFVDKVKLESAVSVTVFNCYI